MKRMDVRKGLRTAGVVLLIACAVLLPGGSVVWADTASEGVIQQARNEAEKLLSLRTAMWLQFTDRWNDYLQDRDAGNPATEPAFASEGAGTSYLNRLVDDKYLPAGFDTDIYSLSFISASGGWLVSVELNEAVAGHVPSFLPMAETSNGKVEYTINRPGASAEFAFFVEKNADNEMGSEGKLTWEPGEGEITVGKINAGEINVDKIGALTAGGDVTFDSPLSAALANFETIEGISGNPITVNSALHMNASLNMGGYDILNAGAGKFASLGVTNDLSVGGSLTVAGLGKFASLKITGGVTLDGDFTIGGTLYGASGEFSGTLEAENVIARDKLTATTGELATLKGTGSGNLLEILSHLNMNGYNINDADTVSGTTGDFTNLKATGLTLNNRTGTSAPKDEYDIWVANAKSADSAKSVKASDITGNIDFSKITGLNGKITKDMLESAVQGALGGGISASSTVISDLGNSRMYLPVGTWLILTHSGFDTPGDAGYWHESISARIVVAKTNRQYYIDGKSTAIKLN